MPKKDGRQVYEEIRKLRPEAKVLLVSGYTADVLKRKGVFNDGPYLMQKPVSPRTLLHKVAELLGR